MEDSLLLGGGLAVLVFGFIAFQNRLVAVLMGARDSPLDDVFDEP